MHDLLDCQILKDGVDYAKQSNKVLRDSLRYRFLYKNRSSVDKVAVQENINRLNTWYRWYNITYCKDLVPCLTTKTTTCVIYVIEIYDPICNPNFTLIEIN